MRRGATATDARPDAGVGVDPAPAHTNCPYITTFGGGVWYGPQDGAGGITPDILPFEW